MLDEARYEGCGAGAQVDMNPEVHVQGTVTSRISKVSAMLLNREIKLIAVSISMTCHRNIGRYQY
jgi:hypothetical protein